MNESLTRLRVESERERGRAAAERYAHLTAAQERRAGQRAGRTRSISAPRRLARLLGVKASRG